MSRSIQPSKMAPPVRNSAALSTKIKPEAVYFTEQHGQRGAVMIVEMSDASKIPALAEPWFLTFNANVEFRVVMTPDDLQKAGLDGIGKKWVQ